MKELMKVDYSDSQRPTVLGRDLYSFLGIKTDYTKWMDRMLEYGFVENHDFLSFLTRSTGGRPSENHQLTLEMAKEIAMIQRNEKGKQARLYFIECENKLKEILFASYQIEDPIKRAEKWIEEQKEKQALLMTTKVQEQQLKEYEPKVSYYDKILQSEEAITITKIAKDYGTTANKMNKVLHKLRIQFKHGGTWLLYADYASEGYTKTKTHEFKHTDGRQDSRIHTYWTQKGRLFLYDKFKAEGIVPLCEQNKEE